MDKALLYVRSALFAVGYVITIFLFAFPSVLTYVLPFEKRFAFISQWARFNLWWLKVTCNLRYEVVGKENIPDGPVVVLCKHQSAWETLAVQMIFPAQAWLLKRELLWIPFFGWGLAVLEPIAIDRSAGRAAMKQLVQQGKERLQDGRWVIIFPEGTRVPPGQHKEFRPGGAILAEKAGVPVLPVAHNAGHYWPKRGFLKRPGVIRIVIGEPISTDGLKSSEINRQTEAWIKEKAAELGAEAEQALLRSGDDLSARDA